MHEIFIKLPKQKVYRLSMKNYASSASLLINNEKFVSKAIYTWEKKESTLN